MNTNSVQSINNSTTKTNPPAGAPFASRYRGLSLLLAALALAHPATAGCPTPSFVQPAGSPVAAGDLPLALALGDFNKDGKSDLAVVNSISDDVTILLGDGAGGFSQPPGSPIGGAGTSPYAIAVGDFNKDGNSDLAVANFLNDSVTVHFGNGSGGFPASSTVPTGTGPFSVAVGDFNKDNKPDLAVANDGDASVTILLGDGFGGFTASSVTVGAHPHSAAVSDFNLDGNPDLAVANFGPVVGDPSTVTILLGDGAGGFVASTIPGGINPQSLAVGDFNLDGKPDLAVGDYNGDAVTILLGNGLGAFSQPPGSPVGVGDQPTSIAVGDFNGDGNPDLSTANLDSTDVTILLGDGSGGFGAFTVNTGVSSWSIVVGDLNLDGRPDVAVPNGGSGSVTILLNACGADLTPPDITCPADITVSTDAGKCSAVVGFIVTATDNSPDPVTIVCTPPSGSAFPIGTTTVCCTATDAAGNSSECCFNVTVTIGSKCPHSQGWWKNHASAWPVSLLMLGAQTYSQTELQAILNTSTTTDASLILARQLIAAILNTANGSNPTPICDTIATTNTLLSGYAGKLPYKVKPTSPAGKQMVSLASTLEQYNKGLLTPGSTP